MARGHVASSGITSLLEHPETNCPLSALTATTDRQARICGPRGSSTNSDKLRGAYSRGAANSLAVPWRRAGPGFTGAGGGGRLILRNRARGRGKVIKQFLRWRVRHRPQCQRICWDAATLTQLARALTHGAGPDERPEHFTRDVIRSACACWRMAQLRDVSGKTISSANAFSLLPANTPGILDVPAGTAFYPEDGPARFP